MGLFLDRRIGFMEIARQVAQAMAEVPAVQNPNLEQIFQAYQAALEAVARANPSAGQ